MSKIKILKATAGKLYIGRRVNPKLLLSNKPLSGVYLIKKNSKVVYVGMSKKSLYKTVIRHCQTWNDKPNRFGHQRFHATFKKDVFVNIFFTSPTDAPILEKALMKKFIKQPLTNKILPNEKDQDAPF